MKKLLYILIAIAVSACVESNTESPSATSSPKNPENLRSTPGPDMLEPGEVESIKALAKTPITQAEFEAMIANASMFDTIVIKRRTGHTLTIGQASAPHTTPELLNFEFIECEFEGGIVVQNTFQQIMNIRRSIMHSVRLETAGVVQYVTIKRSKIEQLTSLEGGRASGLNLIKSKVQHIQNDLGGIEGGVQFIHF